MNYPANKKLNRGGVGIGYLGETKPAIKRPLKAKGQVTLAALLTGCPALTTPNPTLPAQAQITSFSSNSYMALFLNLFQGQNLRHLNSEFSKALLKSPSESLGKPPQRKNVTALILWPPAPTSCARPDTGTSCPASSIISPSGSQPSTTRAGTGVCQGSSHPPRAPWSHWRNSTSCPRLEPPGRPHRQWLWERPRALQAVRRFVLPWMTPHKSLYGSDPPSPRPRHT